MTLVPFSLQNTCIYLNVRNTRDTLRHSTITDSETMAPRFINDMTLILESLRTTLQTQLAPHREGQRHFEGQMHERTLSIGVKPINRDPRLFEVLKTSRHLKMILVHCTPHKTKQISTCSMYYWLALSAWFCSLHLKLSKSYRFLLHSHKWRPWWCEPWPSSPFPQKHRRVKSIKHPSQISVNHTGLSQ